MDLLGKRKHRDDVTFLTTVVGNTMIEGDGDGTKFTDIVTQALPDDDLSTTVCVGHVLSMVVGQCILRHNPHLILNNFLRFVKDDSPGGAHTNKLQYMPAANIDGHATTIYIYKGETKTYIWYNNPWGFSGDRTTIKMGEERDRTLDGKSTFVTQQEAKYPKHYYSAVDDVTDPMYIQGNLTHLYRNDRSLMGICEYRNIYQYGRLLQHLIAKHSSEIVQQAVARSREWGRHNGATTPDTHIMNMIHIMKTVHKKDHIHMVPMHKSMRLIGPQSLYNDGIDINNHAYRAVHGWGACVTWANIYTAHAKHVLDRKSLDHQQILSIIESGIPQNTLLGEKNARILLGKYGYMNTRLDHAKPYVRKLFELVPSMKKLYAGKERRKPFNHPFHKTLLKQAEIAKNRKMCPPRLIIVEFLRHTGIVVNNAQSEQILASLAGISDRARNNLVLIAVNMALLVVDCKHRNIN